MAKVDGFDVPILLIKLYGALKENGGLDEEGIFRLAPDALKCDEMRKGPTRTRRRCRGSRRRSCMCWQT